MFKHGASYLQGGDFRFHCYSIPNSVDERLGPLLKNFAAGCNWRFMQGYGKVPTSAHSAYIGVYVFAASTGRCNPLQAIRSLLGHPTGGPSRGALRHHSSDCLRQRPSVGGYASQFALCAHPTRRLHIPQPKAVREADALAGVRGRIPRRTFAAIAHTQKNRERARKANGK